MRNKPSPGRRIVVTGIGAVTCVGHGKKGLWEGILNERSGVKRISRFDTSQLRSHHAGEINDFDPRTYFTAKQVRRMDRFAQFSMVSTRMAVDDAGLPWNPQQPNPRIGVCMGTALGGISGAEEEHCEFLKGGVRQIHPSLALLVFGGSSSSNIAIEFGFTGPGNCNSNSCASGTMAVGEAMRFIRDGYADIMIAGGAEAPLSPLTFSAFSIINCMSASSSEPHQAYRPFDKHRDGFIMGEGAAALVLEERSHAERRGAHIYAEVLGYSLSNDAHHMTAPRPDGSCAARTMQNALADAGLDPSQIDYVNAHGSGTELNDRIETHAIKIALGTHANKVAISSTKPFHSHPLGASGAIEAAICALCLEHQYVPPTLNLQNPDPECNLDYIPIKGRHQQVRHILSNSFGFGGINSSIVLGRYA